MKQTTKQDSGAQRRPGRILIASGHEISFDERGRSTATTQDAAVWWESLTLMEQAALYERALSGTDLDAERAINAYRNPIRA